MRCNARCDFCDYWKTPASEKATELRSFAEAARFFDPLMVCFTGGEPLLRRDLEDLVAAVNGAVRLKYITLITHGAMLTPERARSLWDAGINQFSISLDFLDERHDRARGIPGLAARILETVPRLRALGIDNVRFNTVIKDENLEHLMEIVRAASALGIGVGFSTYTAMKNGNAGHYPSAERLALVDARRRRAAGVQATPPRRDHQLRLVSAPGPALFPRRAPRPVRLRAPHHSHRPHGLRPPLPRLSRRHALARVSALLEDRLQRVLLRVPRRGAGAADVIPSA